MSEPSGRSVAACVICLGSRGSAWVRGMSAQERRRSTMVRTVGDRLQRREGGGEKGGHGCKDCVGGGQRRKSRDSINVNFALLRQSSLGILC